MHTSILLKTQDKEISKDEFSGYFSNFKDEVSQGNWCHTMIGIVLGEDN